MGAVGARRRGARPGDGRHEDRRARRRAPPFGRERLAVPGLIREAPTMAGLGRRAGGAQIIPRPAAWAEGAPAPWASRLPSHLSVDDVLATVSPHVPTLPDEPAFPGARPSAVLIALSDGPAGAEVLLPRRSWELRNHRGEVSFPGGRIDPGETPV